MKWHWIFQQITLSNQRDVSNIKLKNVDKKMADAILSEVIDQGPSVTFADIGKSQVLSFFI